MLKTITKRGQIIQDKIIKIDPDNKNITFSNTVTVPYTDLVSTINLNILKKIMLNNNILEHYDLSTKPKSFYVFEHDYEIPEYDYIYSINGVYTRKTFYDNYFVLESDKCLDIGKNLLYKVENIPIQIINSINITEVNGIHMLGRYAQWNHKIKFNTLLPEIDRIING